MTAQHSELGALIRTTREAQGLSMEALAKKAGVGRSSLHRIENGLDVQPRPVKVGRILAALGLGAPDVASAVPDTAWGYEVKSWAGRGAMLMAAQAHVAGPTLIAVRGSHVITIHDEGGDDDGDIEGDIARALTEAGFTVAAPVG